MKLTNCGNPIKKIVCLVPMIVTMYPHKQLPAIAPSETTHPIHDIHSTESMPVCNGVASDLSNGSAIDTQPVAQPKPTIIKLA